MSSTICYLDILFTNLWKNLSYILYPIVLDLINLSISTSKFPTLLKSSIITTHLKNPSLDPSLMSDNPPISNLSFISKILEKGFL